MNEQYRAELRSLVGDLDFDILAALMDMDDAQRIENSIFRFAPTSVWWVANKARNALQMLSFNHPDHQTPISRHIMPSDLDRLIETATGTKNWVEYLWQVYDIDDLRHLTVALILALKYFDEGRPTPPTPTNPPSLPPAA